MTAVNIEWIGTLCAFLMVACDLQLIATGTLVFSIPDVLWLTGSHLSTGAGLMASLIALPTALRLKTAHMSPNIDRIYGYTLCYQRLAICVCGALHLLAVMFALAAIFFTTDMCKDLKKIMKSYHTKQSSKVMIDNIQYALQCCGANNHEDWYEINWEGCQLDGGIKRRKHSLEILLREDTDAYPDLALIRNDAVPFSCCSRSTLAACIHQNLIQLGASTISKQGCEKKLQSAARSLLWFEFMVYSVCLILELVILALLKKQPNFLKSKCGKYPRSESSRTSSSSSGTSSSSSGTSSSGSGTSKSSSTGHK